MAGRSALNILERDDLLLAATWYNVYVTLWRGTATLEALRHVGQHQRDIDKRFPDGYCALAVIHASSARLDPEVRAEAARLTQNPGPNLKAIAQVIQGTGLGAATTRMLATGLMLLRKTKMPSKLFDDVPAAVHWLMRYVKADTPGATPIAEDLVAALEQAWPHKSG
jgi:hypothetical protein